MNAYITRTALAGTAAIGTLVALGIASSVSPEFKYHATTACIVLLALVSIAGVLAAAILRRSDQPPGLTPTAQRPAAARQTVVSAHHTWGHR
jgi:uncharacterized membrane protein AbrB (regulator of aidB expression)